MIATLLIAAQLAAPAPALASASPTPVPSVSGLPAPAPTAAPAAVPSAAASAAVPSPAATSQAAPPSSLPVVPGTTPAPSPVATTSPTPFLYRFVPRQPDTVPPGTPQIFAVYLNDEHLRSQGPIDIKVSTSPDVVKVVSRSGGQEGIVPKVAPGDFEAYSKLPKVPFIAKGITVYLEFVATGPTGLKTTVRVPVKLL